MDDHPVHQTAESLAHPASGDRNTYDRYFFNGFDAEGEVFFAVALGLYPNRHVIDGAVSVLHQGVQHTVQASGRLPVERSTAVGPLRVEIVEPLRSVRIVLDAPSTELALDARFDARSPAIEEPRFRMDHGSRRIMDYTRCTQLGTWTGELTVDGRLHRLTPEVHLGTRDRSWGVRPVGEQPEPGAPLEDLPQFFWLWGPASFADHCVHFDVNEHADGRRWHEFGSLIPLLEPDASPCDSTGVEPVRGVTHELTWEPGTRRAREARVVLDRWSTGPLELRYEPLITFPMSRLGYLGSHWPHGAWQGEDVTREHRVDVSDADPTSFEVIHVQQLCRVHAGDAVGTGVLEQLVLNAHEPSGLTGFLDGAPRS